MQSEFALRIVSELNTSLQSSWTYKVRLTIDLLASAFRTALDFVEFSGYFNAYFSLEKSSSWLHTK